MQLCYTQPINPSIAVQLNDQILVNGQTMVVKVLPAAPGDSIRVAPPRGNFQDSDFHPEVLGMTWRP